MLIEQKSFRIAQLRDRDKKVDQKMDNKIVEFFVVLFTLHVLIDFFVLSTFVISFLVLEITYVAS